MAADTQSANRAVLIGMIAGALSTFDDQLGPVSLEAKDGNYTGRIFIDRPTSGRWVLTVEPHDD